MDNQQPQQHPAQPPEHAARAAGGRLHRRGERELVGRRGAEEREEDRFHHGEVSSQARGNAVERNLAGWCMQLVAAIEREMDFAPLGLGESALRQGSTAAGRSESGHPLLALAEAALPSPVRLLRCWRRAGSSAPTP